MNNIGKNVDSMNFDELRSFVKVLANNVQELSDLYAKTKREYNDMLYNLSRDNLSIEYIQEEKEFVNSTVGDKMKDYSTIEQTEEKIKLTVGSSVSSLKQYSEDEFKAATEVSSIEEMTDKSKLYKIPIPGTQGQFTYYCYYAPLNMWVPINIEQQKFSTIEQTAEKIATSVNSAMASVDTKFTQYSTTEQTADKIASAVEEVKSSIGQPDLTEYTKIEQTANAITQTAYRGIDLSEATEISGEEFLPEEYDGSEYFISHGGYGSNSERTYYAYNYALGKYMPILDGQSIYTIFEQTAEGFKFKGDVKIFGVLSGVEYSDIENEAKLRLSASDSNKNPYPSLVYEEVSSKEESPNKELFRITYDDAGTVYFLLNSNQVGYVGVDMATFYPVGKWSFSQADVEGLGVVPVFG